VASGDTEMPHGYGLAQGGGGLAKLHPGYGNSIRKAAIAAVGGVCLKCRGVRNGTGACHSRPHNRCDKMCTRHESDKWPAAAQKAAAAALALDGGSGGSGPASGATGGSATSLPPSALPPKASFRGTGKPGASARAGVRDDKVREQVTLDKMGVTGRGKHSFTFHLKLEPAFTYTNNADTRHAPATHPPAEQTGATHPPTCQPAYPA